LKLLIIGNEGGTNIGASLLRGARHVGIETALLSSEKAWRGNRVVRSVSWHLLRHKPPHLAAFSREIVDTAVKGRFDAVLFTGIAPCDRAHVEELRTHGIPTADYLTDDPFNRAHRAPWFLRAVAKFDFVFSPRRAPIRELQELGCRSVTYLPFAYDPFLFGPLRQDQVKTTDVVFVGGADADRAELLRPLLASGLRVALYGDYWGRYRETRAAGRGHASPDEIRRAVGETEVALCIPRRANRDGHTMWTFESSVLGACLLVERTQEHLDLFGEDGRAVLYFQDGPELLRRARWLLAQPAECRRLSMISQRLIIDGAHTYADRVKTMVDAMERA
jgi:spore maturation protein CgeB